MANGNANGKLLPWLVGLLFPALVGAAAGLISNIRQFEGRVSALEASHQLIEKRLDSIERKLDRIIEHSRER
jgi:hypothetical protein